MRKFGENSVKNFLSQKKIAWIIQKKKTRKNWKLNQEWLAQKTGIKTNKLSIIFNFQFKKTKKVSGIWKRKFYEEKCAKLVGKWERISLSFFRFPFSFPFCQKIYRFFVMCFFGLFCLGSWLACAPLSHVLLNCFVIWLRL